MTWITDQRGPWVKLPEGEHRRKRGGGSRDPQASPRTVCRCLGLLAKFRYGCLRSHAPSGLDTKLHLSTQLSVIGVTRRCEGGKGQAVRLSSARVVKKRGVSLLALALGEEDHGED